MRTAAEISTDPVDRRRFLNRAWLGALTIFGVAFGGASIATLWPEVEAGRYGSKIRVAPLKDVRADLARSARPMYNQRGRFYLVAYDTSDPNNRYVVDGVASHGLMALYQKCSHLGCRTPYCPTSGFFECPCHGAIFNQAGEVRGGPAPAGLWRFPVSVDRDGFVVVDTKNPVAQPPRGTNTTGQEAGPHCLEDVRVEF